jgi:hypothetical protein
MLNSHQISIFDRVKELSYTLGTGNLLLNGPVPGFSSFGTRYQNNQNLFYAITDGARYEIGSGVYLNNQIIRFPFISTNNNNVINFPEGIKEVYATYPATNCVFTASGIQGYGSPRSSGIAYWSNANTLNYDSSFVWDETNNRLGVNKNTPLYSIDIGGESNNSLIRSSGLIVGSSGVYFPPQNNGDSSYIGGRQLAHYEVNRLDDYAFNNELIDQLTGSSHLLELSGVVNQFILLKRQNAGTILAGPPSGCAAPCSPAYPSFRTLTVEDIPNLNSLYLTEQEWVSYSGILNNRVTSVSGLITSTSGIFRNDLSVVSGMLVSASGSLRNDLITASGALRSNDTAISGYFQSKTQNITEYSAVAMGITGYVGINYTPRSDSSLSVKKTGNNASNVFGSIIDCDNVISTSGDYGNIGQYIIARSSIASGVYNSGSFIGSTMICQRNLTSPNDAGRLASLYAASVTYGHNNAFAQNPVTDSAIGLNISCYALSGTISNAYDLVLSASGTNTNNHWGIYQISPNDNYLAGNLGLNISQPTARLDINSDKMRLRTSKTPASGTAPGNVGDICWDSDYIYVCVSTNNWKRSSLTGW